jgi:hypothetical protein
MKKKVLRDRGDMFAIIKFVSVMAVPRIKYLSNIDFYNGIYLRDIFISLNILEAIISDITNDNIINAVYGALIIVLLQLIKDVYMGIKIWCLFYFMWNMRFCAGKGYGKSESIAHNLPALIKILMSVGYSNNELLEYFMACRTGSIAAVCIINRKLIVDDDDVSDK